ncbi:C40 family peptidase [Cellulosimicrobium terreum]|nr:C40 family peptidase [Cellulosimicrobium terreum]
MPKTLWSGKRLVKVRFRSSESGVTESVRSFHLTVKNPTVASKLYLNASKTSQVKGKTPAAVSLRATAGSSAGKGTVYVSVDGKLVKKASLKSGKARVTMPKTLWSGKRLVKVRFRSSVSGVTESVRSFHLTVKNAGSPVVAEAKKHVGVRYRSGGTSPSSGFDCSGFTSYVYKKAGVKTLPRTSSAQRNVGTKVSRSSAKPGDLIWTPGHVAIYLGGNMQIDAPRPGKTIQVRQIWQSSPTFIRVSNKAIGA